LATVEKYNPKKTRVTFIPVTVPRMEGRFNLSDMVIRAIRDCGEEVRDGDIVAVSSKFVSMSKGRMVKLNDVKVTRRGRRLAERFKMNERLAELVIEEADAILGGVEGFTLALKNGVIAPNAGIDRSNTPQGYVMLYSKDFFKDAEDLRRRIVEETDRRVGIVVTDSRLMPLRRGTTGLAVAVAGFEPLRDERGRRDLFGKILKVTQRALADQVAAGAQLLMGETDEEVPIVIVRASNGTPWTITDKRLGVESLTVRYDECIYMNGIPRPKLKF